MLKPLCIPVHDCMACSAHRCKLRRQPLVHLSPCPPSMLPAWYRQRCSLRRKSSRSSRQQGGALKRTCSDPSCWADPRSLVVDLGERIPLPLHGENVQGTEEAGQKCSCILLSQGATRDHAAVLESHTEIIKPQELLSDAPCSKESEPLGSLCPLSSRQHLGRTRSMTRRQAQVLPKSPALESAIDPKLSQYAHVCIEGPLFGGGQYLPQPDLDHVEKVQTEEEQPPKQMVSFPPFVPPKRLRLVVSHGSINLEVAANSCEELSCEELS